MGGYSADWVEAQKTSTVIYWSVGVIVFIVIVITAICICTCQYNKKKRMSQDKKQQMIIVHGSAPNQDVPNH